MWTPPTTRTTGEKITSAIWNSEIVDNLYFLDLPIILIRDEKTVGTQGGTFTQGAWRTRDLNAEYFDTSNRVSVSANQITFTPGTYGVSWSAPAYFCNNHQTRLQNITAGTTLGVGTSELANAATIVTRSIGYCSFTVVSNTLVELQHYCILTSVTAGFGAAASIDTEVYAMLFIRLLG